MAPAPETVRLLRLAGAFTYLLVAAPPVIEGIDRGAPFVAWLASFLLSGALFGWTISRLQGPDPTRWGTLAGQAACAIVMAATDYRGLEGTLLVLVALQLGLLAPRRVGFVWIIVQSLALMWAIQHRWSLRPALMWAPPYLGFQLLTFVMVELLGREARARAELSRTNTELLSTRERLAASARVGERLRIARELHDAMGHHLVGLSLNLEALVQRQGPSSQLDAARTLTRRLLDDVESLVDTLGSDQRIDLPSALAVLAGEIPRPRVHVSTEGLAVQDPERTHTLWRCCQEIVTNTVKHAHAENLWMTIQMRDGQVELIARDDGRGAASVGAGHGLEGMRRRLEEQGGALDLETHPGAGFLVKVRLPCGPTST
jgi:signal transduction histidine kinase